jgi:coronin-7
MEFFQDDIFIPTRDLESSSLSAQQWFDGEDKDPKLIDLRPSDMAMRTSICC